MYCGVFYFFGSYPQFLKIFWFIIEAVGVRQMSAVDGRQPTTHFANKETTKNGKEKKSGESEAKGEGKEEQGEKDSPSPIIL